MTDLQDLFLKAYEQGKASKQREEKEEEEDYSSISSQNSSSDDDVEDDEDDGNVEEEEEEVIVKKCDATNANGERKGLPCKNHAQHFLAHHAFCGTHYKARLRALRARLNKVK